MGRQLRLVLLLLLSTGVFQVAFTTTTVPRHIIHEDLNDLDSSNEDLLTDLSSGIKISTPKAKETPVISTTSNANKSTPQPSSTHKPVSDEILNDLIEASKHSVALADDPRFNKMLPEKYKMENATTTNKSEEAYDDYDNYEYDDDYNYDDTTTVESTKKSKSDAAKLENSKDKHDVEMKPIKESNKLTSIKAQRIITDHHNDILNSPEDNETHRMDEDDDDDDDYDDEDDDEDDIADEEEIIYNENVPCPRYCVCARNINSYLVATCSRFDPGTQKFGSDITDLVVTDVGPKYPIVMGPEFFLQMGLKHVSSIKIANCTVEYLHPDAFHGLDELYSVNLTNLGLAMFNPDTFVRNKKLRMLTISGNDLSVMSSLQYLLNSSSIEELDLSSNNLMELNPHAFTHLSNIVYINLAKNNIKEIPSRVFDSVETIEELNLSHNQIKSLPPTVFNRTALAILNLKGNEITNDLRFGSSDLQQLDLSFNSIKQIHHGMFDKMTSLTNLNLQGNAITKIQTDSFLTLKNLRHIDLSINELDQVSSMLFYRNSELDVIRLNDNPRLSQLPTDGFRSYNGYFTVYFLDISNCAIGALGHKTFATMPHLATLKLAWNNINNLERDTFSSLTKLTDLDLSNNLIYKLDELTFINNDDLTKLNLAGNPIRRLSVRLFLPLSKLRELDVSDCELNTLLTDNQYGVGRKYKFYDTLRSFNASANQIKRISSLDVKLFRNLRTLDISNNPLKCNEDFQDFISYVSLNTNMVPKQMPSLSNLEDATSFIKLQSHAGWAELAHKVCKHREAMNNNKLDKRIHEADDNLDEDAKHLLDIMENSKARKMQKILTGSRTSEVVINDHHKEEEKAKKSEEELKLAKEDDEGENASDYDEDDDDDNDDDDDDDADEDTELDIDSVGKKQSKITDLPQLVPTNGIETGKNQRKKLMDTYPDNGDYDDDDDDDDEPEEEIIIERGRIYYSGYKFLIPVVIMVSILVVILLIVAKIVSLVMRKRGERYRMALLASAKNTIVYQKLTEDIKAAEKESRQPKVHRYAPINQV